MDRLWTPWRYAYISGTGTDPAPGVPPALAAWCNAADPPQDWPQDRPQNNRYCVFCNMIAAVDYAVAHGMQSDHAHREALIVQRQKHTFICLNRFPYATGHVLIVPYQHCDSLAGLPAESAQELITSAQHVETGLRAIYRPDGFNFGLNLGEAAGAGVATHMHLHGLPRWFGDTNFMTVTAETRVLPETLDLTWEKLRNALGDLTAP